MLVVSSQLSVRVNAVPSLALVGVLSLRVLKEVTGLVAASIRATGMVPDAAGRVVGRV
jgi:xanthosine utilization system XapX-like protein